MNKNTLIAFCCAFALFLFQLITGTISFIAVAAVALVRGWIIGKNGLVYGLLIGFYYGILIITLVALHLFVLKSSQSNYPANLPFILFLAAGCGFLGEKLHALLIKR